MNLPQAEAKIAELRRDLVTAKTLLAQAQNWAEAIQCELGFLFDANPEGHNFLQDVQDFLTENVHTMSTIPNQSFEDCSALLKDWLEAHNEEIYFSERERRRAECSTGPCTAGLMPGEHCSSCGKLCGGD